MTIAFTGASGQLGRLVVNKLKRQGPADTIVGLVRNRAKAADLGVNTREADYDKPETLGKALAGVDTLLLISSSEVGTRAAQHGNVIHAAKQAGVKWILYTSLLHADRTSIDLATEHLATERERQASGIPFTLLRNGWYTENYTRSAARLPAAGSWKRRKGENRIGGACRLRRGGGCGAARWSGEARRKNLRAGG